MKYIKTMKNLKKMKQEILREHFSELGKLSHKKTPRSKEHYQELQKKSVEARKRNQEQKSG